MPRLLLNLCASLVVLFQLAGLTYAQERPVLASKSISKTMQGFINEIQNPQSRPLKELPRADGYFVRIARRTDVLTEKDEIKSTAFLGRDTKPFVFLTTPQSIFGRSLYQIYAAIGYEAEDIFNYQLDKEMVAIVFRYDERDVSLSEVKDGTLDKNWPHRTYETTWDNIMSLFAQLVQDDKSAPCKNGPKPATRICLPELQARFVTGFPEEGKLRIKTTRYRALQASGGADWIYRTLLEDSLSVFEHFRGDSWTENELEERRDKPAPRSLREVVAPNRWVGALPEYAVIGLGTVVIVNQPSRKAQLN
jgi:hypothetical protein